MLFFALCGRWVLTSEAFRITGGDVLLLVALDTLRSKRQQRKRNVSTPKAEEIKPGNVAIFLLAPCLPGRWPSYR